jgi:hypothetical protein
VAQADCKNPRTRVRFGLQPQRSAATPVTHRMRDARALLLLIAIASPGAALHAQAADAEPGTTSAEPRRPGLCAAWEPASFARNPTAAELRCRHGVRGPGRFGLLSYLDVPVYQPATPMPGTHLAGVPGYPGPRPWETFEEWEWRVLRTHFGPEARTVHRSLELLDPVMAARIISFERRLAEEGIPAIRRETWRSPYRQAWLFQQGRSRPGPIATATLTSWHGQVDARGSPAGRAVDYDVPPARMPRFHEIAAEVGLASFGYDSHDPGHVFLPASNEIARGEVELLRLLPRVPEVTLATGLPVDRTLPPGGRAELRERVGAFIGEPFLRPLLPELAGELRAREPILTARAPEWPQPPRRRRWFAR